MSNPKQLPSFYAGILFHSRSTPHAVAVVYGQRTITFRAFCKHIENVTRRLHDCGFEPGTRVGVAVQDGYLKWLLVIALARMGLASVSLGGHPGEADFVKAGVVLHDGKESPGRRNITVGEDWGTAAADDLPAFRDRLHELAAPCRIVLSSGTTGLPKKALFTYEHLRARGRGTARTFGFNASTRLLITMPITTIGGFWMPVTVWSNGGAVVLTQPQGQVTFTRILMRSQPNVVFTSTAQLGAIVNELPADFFPGEHLVAWVAGSALPAALNRKARLRLTQSLFTMYGSTEAGGVSVAHAALSEARPSFAGWVLPTAQVEVVDEHGGLVANGEMGEVRIRAEGLVDEYLEDTAANDGSFRDGWFYPGDAGILDDEGGLSIVGRTRELMNFGGVKVSPDSVEAELSKLPGMTDMAVFALEGPGGNQRPCVAVVAGEDFDESAIVRRFKRVWPTLPPIMISRVTAIPRNEMGKILRIQLAATVGQAAAQAQSGSADQAAIAASRPR